VPLAGGCPGRPAQDRRWSGDDHVPQDAAHGARIGRPMTTPRPSLVVTGQIVVAALLDGLQTAEAIGIADGVVMIAGSAGDVRDARGRPNGLLRESAADLVGDQAERMVGVPLAIALRETAAELLGLGITGVTDAGDPTTSNGHGAHAALGDSFANLAAAEQAVEGGLRVTLNLPADGLDAAAELRLHAGDPVTAVGWLRVGWAKLFADGALGS